MSLITRILYHLPYTGDILRQRDQLLALNGQLRDQLDQLWQPPGHFYSPIPDVADIKSRATAIFDRSATSLPGINLNEKRQIELLKAFQSYYDTQPFTAQQQENRRYYFENPHYSYSDAIFLHCMMRYSQPQQIIEVGSGFSSCVMLDTNELFFANHIQLTHIEPYPNLLYSLLRPGDRERVEILPQKLQEIPLDRFQSLRAGDILFIDSTHVSKTGSDVNYLFFEILPSLAPGVYVHIHDIFYPFEYPAEWVYNGRAWNEAYLLRGFLQYNEAFSIQFFNTYLEQVYEPRFREKMPLCLKDPGGSLWLRKEII